MKRILFLFLAATISLLMHAQTSLHLTIEECYTLARQNYPLVKQQELIVKTKDYSVENASKGYLPQLNIGGQASYQSAVTEIPIKLPNVTTISKDQYKLYGELNQTVYDGGIIKTQKESLEANALVETQKLEVELKKLKDRVNQLFFGILMADEQLTQIELLKKDIQLGIDKTKASIANGTALKSSADALQAELLKAGQRTIETKATRKGLIDMLGLFINKTLDENIVLEKPAAVVISQTINRPELSLIDEQKKMVDVQTKILYAKNLPKVGLFLQAGVGRPALNMLNNDFAGYYIGGLRLNWPLSGLYTYRNEKTILGINSQLLDIQKETFLLNTNYVLKQQNSEITKLQELVQSDDAIIALRTKIKNTSVAQLENGVITSSDYMRELDAEDQARQNQLLHRVQLLMAQYNLKWTTEN
jgi:outer membrane protein TolC